MDHSRRTSFVPRLLAVCLAVAMLAAACGDSGESFDGGGPGPGNDTGTTEDRPGCDEPGPRVGRLLPSAAGAPVEALSNPCITFARLQAEVLAVVPSSLAGRLDDFFGHLTRLVSRVLAVDDVATCAYERDRLAIQIYREPGTPASIGVVAVVRGDLDAVTDTAACFVMNQIDPFLNLTAGGTQPANESAICFDAFRPRVDGETYTVLYLGSSATICGVFAEFYGDDPAPPTSPPPPPPTPDPHPSAADVVVKLLLDGAGDFRAEATLTQREPEDIVDRLGDPCFDLETGRSIRIDDVAVLDGAAVRYNVVASLMHGPGCPSTSGYHADGDSGEVRLEADGGHAIITLELAAGDVVNPAGVRLAPERHEVKLSITSRLTG